ncbi:MAG: sugar phosphate isomerase/epimerase family protein [Promethearchaeia archaeon]
MVKLGLSSLAFINDCRIYGKYNDAQDILLDASQKALNFAEENEISICEFILDPPLNKDDDNVEKFIELCNSFTNITKQVHAPYIDINLASHNVWIREASIECYEYIAKICKKIGSKIYTIHPGSTRYLKNYNKKINFSKLFQSVNYLLEKISYLDLIVCIENMQKKTGILTTLEEILYFFNNINRNDIFFTWDTSHSWTCNVDVGELWGELHDKIKNIHLVDNFSKNSDIHPALGTGKINFNEIFEILNQYNYSGSIVLEIGSVKNLKGSIEFVLKFF